MATAKKQIHVNPKVVAQFFVEKLRTMILQRLLAYCKKRAVEVGLTTPALACDYDMYGSSAARKTVGKLKAQINKYLVKRIPYLAMAKGELLEAYREMLQFNLVTPEIIEDFADVDWHLISNGRFRNGMSNYDVFANTSSSIRSHVFNNHKTQRWVKRYVRYMNYMARKYCLPIQLTATIEHHTVDPEATNKMYNMPARERNSIKMPFKIHTKIQVGFVRWVCNDEDRHDRARQSGEDDVLYAEEQSWHPATLINSRHDSYPSAYRYNFEMLFANLENVIRAVATLSRKHYYETSAYTFRSVQAS